MLKKLVMFVALIGAYYAAALTLAGQATPTPAVAGEAAVAATPSVERGRYLVTIMLCNDCHTPWKAGEKGPEPDMTRMLSGHPQDVPVEGPVQLPEGWMAATNSTFTAWSGPWGVSFTANLTPDPETGLGGWTAETFIAAMRSGRHEGLGRPILPPMPYPLIAKATDEDLRAMFAYLQSIPPVKNRVPQPIEPVAAK